MVAYPINKPGIEKHMQDTPLENLSNVYNQ